MGKREEQPIDIVLTWVDGSDPNWREEKEKYVAEESTSVHSFDYQDWGLLPYWFRCIEKNAPWARYIYLVTWGHLPKWLKIEHPKLKIVNHTEFIPSKYLPTFSSHTIELNLHRIQGLAENFIYFNDDTFLLKPVRSSFFFKNNLPCDCAINNPIAPANSNCIASLMLTTTGVINENFSKMLVMRKHPAKWINFRYSYLLLLNLLFLPWSRFVGLYESHLPTSMKKSTFVEVWEKEYELLDATCTRKFRDFKVDVNQWIFKDWQIAKGEFSPRSIYAGKRFAIKDVMDAEVCAKTIASNKTAMICVNDHILDETCISNAARVIRAAFDVNYGEKSSFER